MDCTDITLRYYARWLGLDAPLDSVTGVEFVRSAERDRVQYGYTTPFDFWCWRQPGRLVVSYGEKCAPAVPALRGILRADMTPDALSAALTGVFGREPGYNIKYIYAGTPGASTANPLAAADYPTYRAFFLACNPGCNIDGWLRDYFDEMAADGLCVGVFDGGVLASCTDAPGMPFMADEVQEIGINTLPAYRGRGCATAACLRCAANILALGKCPLWSTTAGNTASRRLAERVGFRELGEVFSYSL